MNWSSFHKFTLFLLSIFYIVATTSCGERQKPNKNLLTFKPGFTEVRFNDVEQRLNKAASIASIPLLSKAQMALGFSAPVLNQIMIYAVRQNSSIYTETMKLENEVDNSPESMLSLPNGVYKFYAIGYTAGTGIIVLSSVYRRCGVIGPVTLNGESKVFDLRITSSECANNPDFTNSLYKYSSLNIAMQSALYSCSSSAVFPGSTTNCGGFCADCTGTPGSIQSFQIRILGYSNTGSGYVDKPNASSHITSCIQSGAPPGFYTPYPLDIPIGTTVADNKPNFRVEIATDMTNTNCSTVGISPGKRMIFGESLFSAHGTTYSIGGGAVKMLPDDTNLGNANLYFDH